MSGHIYFEIQADNLEKARSFYSSIFGWKFEKASEDTPLEYWRIETRGNRGGLLKRPANKPPAECGTNAFVCSFEVDDIDVFEKKILKYNGKVTLSKFPIPGVCWHAYFMDPEGNNFGIFQPDEKAGF